MEKKRLKIGFYNPYFDGLGGGERYALTLASHWSKTHDVSLFWDDPNILGISEKRFGIDLAGIQVVPNIFKNANIFGKLWESRKYDLIFFLSDGSIPTTLAKHNILHFQVPFASVLSDPWKLKRYDAIVCNSQFTRRELDPELSHRAVVIYPPVKEVKAIKKVAKKKQILTVGRFTAYAQAKKQEVLIEAFIQGVREGTFRDWEFVLAGGLMDSDRSFFDHLKDLARNLPIRLMPNISNEELMSLYQQSKVYWHAAGFGEMNPEHMEHFGITTVEAMSAGVVPIVFAAGGQLEIVTDGVNGTLWHTPQELLSKTKSLIDNTKQYETYAMHARKRAADFSVEQFTRGFDAIIAGW